MSPGAEIDVTLVAGCRPDLLATTLQSFSDRLFAHFRVRDVFVNIDPVFGDTAAGDACAALVRDHFPGAEITRPESPGFGRAVKTVWSKSGSRPVFHLEDDWEALQPILPAAALGLLTGDVGMVAPASRTRRPDESPEAMRIRRRKLFGITLRKEKVNGFGTAPRFLAAGLAARFGELLDPLLDPEKQVLHDRNPALCRLQEQFRCLTVWAPDGGPLVADTGRAWRDARGIHKVYTKSSVRWVDAQRSQDD